ncbi:VOC family protein [Roseovarius phycicola]|uniref:VOC family protein n=1 Tax=Roseovarius phycicola TaxID=3080976 RepID=A0ABZ2HF91_9RHOB
MTFSQPVPALPVHSVVEAQHYYQEKLGFDIAWHNVEGRIGAVSHGTCALFFREVDGDVAPCVLWVFVADVDDAFAELSDRGAEVVEFPEDKPWGLRQFTVRDLHGHLYHFHCDL